MSAVLVVGSGAREHCFAVKLAQSPLVSHVYVAPGNGGTEGAKLSSVAIPSTDFPALIAFCREKHVVLTVVGPEQPLVEGIVDAFSAAGLRCWGPNKQAAQLEGSKAFSKEFMKRHNIPTARFGSFTNYDDAVEFVRSSDYSVVVKASGLAAGKGVVVPNSTDEALAALREMMVDRVFGDAGTEVVVEERLEGPEVSVFVLCDGTDTGVVMPAAQDHKRAFDGDKGPNTGGMGAYCPAPVVTPEVARVIQETIVSPSLRGIRADGMSFVGVLFVGIMLTPAGPKVLEYNCRSGDPETQAVFSLLETDLFVVLNAAVSGTLASVPITFKPQHACTVVAASGGYPGNFQKGFPITGLDAALAVPGATVFHAGTKRTADGIMTAGGRVLSVTAVGDTLQGAVKTAYAALSHIAFSGKMFRTDIAHRALSVSYADAGVNIEEGDRFVEEIKSIVASTARTGGDAKIGGFGGLFDLGACGFQDPILVSGTDGVGTKLMIAHEAQLHHTIGIDLVAMCVNDILVQGAEPLFFLDYFATGKLAVDTAKKVLVGIADGCRQGGCALVGGETAEMPGLYHPGTYDLAGFAVGAVERDMVLPRLAEIVGSEVVLALPSSGVHSNGFSLVRHLVARQGLPFSGPAPFSAPGHTSLASALLVPTRIYVKALLPLIKARLILGMAHITGGGLIGNIPRTLPEDIGVELDASAWPFPPVMKWLSAAGNMTINELATTFNCGIGMALVVSRSDAPRVQQALAAAGEAVYVVGNTVKLGAAGSKRHADGSVDRVFLRNTQSWLSSN